MSEESLYFEPFPIIVVQHHLGQNRDGGRDVWVTFRGGGDRMSSDAILVGVVQNGSVTADLTIVPLDVVKHLHSCLMSAYAAFDAECEKRESGAQYDEDRVSNGPLAFLPEKYTAVFTTDAITGNKTRYFVRWSRKGIDEMLRSAA